MKRGFINLMCTAETTVEINVIITVEINVIIDEIIMERNTRVGMWLKQIYRKYFAGSSPEEMERFISQ